MKSLRLLYIFNAYLWLICQQSLIACRSWRVRDFWEFPHFCWHVSWCYNYVGFLYVTILLRFHDCSFPVVYRRRHLTADVWLSTSYHLSPPSSAVFPVSGVDASCVGWQLHHLLFSAFGPGVYFCNHLHLPQEGASMTRAGGCAYLTVGGEKRTPHFQFSAWLLTVVRLHILAHK